MPDNYQERLSAEIEYLNDHHTSLSSTYYRLIDLCSDLIVEVNRLTETTTYKKDAWDDYWTCTKCEVDWCYEYDPSEGKSDQNYCPSCGRKITAWEKEKEDDNA